MTGLGDSQQTLQRLLITGRGNWPSWCFQALLWDASACGVHVPSGLRLWEGNLKEYLPSPEQENVTPRETIRVRVSGELGS